MTLLDQMLDSTLLGYSKVGFAARGLSVAEPFPALTTKHVMVTGATGGLGRAAAKRFAANGAVVHAVGRNEQKLDRLIAELDGHIVGYVADLSLMEDNVTVAASFVDLGEPLYGLVNNVGVMSGERVTTREGFELAYATNLLGQYVLTQSLLDGLGLNRPRRIVFVSSGGMYSQALSAENIESNDGDYSATKAYSRTKRGQVVLASQLAATTGEATVVTSMHPGWVDTEGVKTSLPTFRRLTRPVLRDAPQGADTMVWLVGSMHATDLDGEFVHDRSPRQKHRMSRTKVEADVTKTFMAKLVSDAGPYLA
jgi:NAD(P)-dependent dehydrogenase (short-subunit alcohol dehydrogenase family)